MFMNWKTQLSKEVSLPKLIHQFNAIHIKFPARLFVDLYKIIPEVIGKCKGTGIPKTTFKKESEM